MVDGNRHLAPAAAAYGATPPAAPPNSRERDIVSALAGARRRPLGAAVAQSSGCGEHQTKKWLFQLLTAALTLSLGPPITPLFWRRVSFRNVCFHGRWEASETLQSIGHTVLRFPFRAGARRCTVFGRAAPRVSSPPSSIGSTFPAAYCVRGLHRLSPSEGIMAVKA